MGTLRRLLRQGQCATIVMLALVAAIACRGDRRLQAVDLSTDVDSTGDTIHVRIRGEVAEHDVRTLSRELEVGALNGPEATAFDEISLVLGSPGGGLLVLDSDVPAIREFDAQGAFVREIGRRGAGPGEYAFVSGMARLPDGRLAVWDAGNSRINVYGADGAFLTSWRNDFQRYGYDLLKADRAGNLYADAVLGRSASVPPERIEGFIKLDRTGRVIDSIAVIAWQPDPTPAKASTPDGGNSITYAIPFAPGNETRVSPTGGLVSGYGDAYVFYILPSDGKPIRVEREHQPVPVSADEDRDWRTYIEFFMRRVDPAWTWGRLRIPTEKSAYRSLAVGMDGRVWVRISTHGEAIPSQEQAARGPEDPPVRTTREPDRYDVYEPDGCPLGRIAIPRGVTVLSTDGDHVWGVRLDSLGVPHAGRYRIEPGLARSP